VITLVRESLVHNKFEVTAILDRDKGEFYMQNVFGVHAKAFVAKLVGINYDPLNQIEQPK
jgi:cytosine/uracil/thiamine/allantoin permease